MTAGTRRPPLLVVAGEASGDGMAARVVETLGVPAAGMGGRALERAGAELWFDLRRVNEMGALGPLGRVPHLVRAYRGLLARIRQNEPRAALLVGFSEFNARLGAVLKRRGVRVLWYAPPQIWAWRPARAAALTRSSHMMALLFPFEVEPWQRAGAEVHYVGHPALEKQSGERARLRSEFGLSPDRLALALLPGSRASEVRRLLPQFLDAVARIEAPDLHARLLLSTASLSLETVDWARQLAAHARIPVSAGSSSLPAFDAAMVASGTATLECALQGVPPCIAYRTDRLTASLARRLLRVDQVGLPNLVLGKNAFPELLQEAATPDNLARATSRLLEERSSYRARCAEVRAVLTDPPVSPTRSVASLLEPWLK